MILGYREGSGRPKTCAGYIQWVEDLIDAKYSQKRIARMTGVSKSVVGRIALAKKSGMHY